MRVREIISIAVDEAGRVFCTDGAGLARLEDGRLVEHGALAPRTQITSLAARPGGGVLLVDAYANRLLAVDDAGETAHVAGRPQPPSLDRRGMRRDGAALDALFRSPHLVAAAAGRIFCVELPPP